MTPTDPAEINAELDALMGERLGVGGNGFGAKVRRAGRLLPRHVRREARYLVQAGQMSAHPRLAPLVDPQRVAQAAETCRSYLTGIDAADRRWGIVVGRLSVIAFNWLLLAALVIALLTWRGYLGPDPGPGASPEPMPAQSPG